MQRPVRAGMRLALSLILGLRLKAFVRAGRRAGIVRRLRRQTELGFKLRDARRQKLALVGQRGDDSA